MYQPREKRRSIYSAVGTIDLLPRNWRRQLKRLTRLSACINAEPKSIGFFGPPDGSREHPS